jgi:hypothetical protein
MITTLAVVMIAEVAVAGPNCIRNPDHPKCVIDEGGSSGKVFAVKVKFDDGDGDTIKSDGANYISDSGVFPDSGVGARLPVEYSPPGQFVMTTRLSGDRTLFFDFGEAVDCTPPHALSDDGTCVLDNTVKPIPCLFPPGERFDAFGLAADGQCSGYRQVVMGFRHSVNPDTGGEIEYMLGMTNDETFDGKAGGAEIDFREESNRDDDLRLRFDNKCLGQDVGDFLKITAWRVNEEPDGLPNDHWKIDTVESYINTNEEEVITSTTKVACLTKKGNGKREDLVGLFDMQFGYEICILADPDGLDDDVDDDACFESPNP